MALAQTSVVLVVPLTSPCPGDGYRGRCWFKSGCSQPICCVYASSGRFRLLRRHRASRSDRRQRCYPGVKVAGQHDSKTSAFCGSQPAGVDLAVDICAAAEAHRLQIIDRNATFCGVGNTDGRALRARMAAVACFIWIALVEAVAACRGRRHTLAGQGKSVVLVPLFRGSGFIRRAIEPHLQRTKHVVAIVLFRILRGEEFLHKVSPITTGLERLFVGLLKGRGFAAPFLAPVAHGLPRIPFCFHVSGF